MVAPTAEIALLEANLAGTSFLTPDKTGKLKYASPIVTLYADKTTPGGLATCGWDDDGVKTQKWDLVKDGLFVGWQTTREQAKWKPPTNLPEPPAKRRRRGCKAT